MDGAPKLAQLQAVRDLASGWRFDVLQGQLSEAVLQCGMNLSLLSCRFSRRWLRRTGAAKLAGKSLSLAARAQQLNDGGEDLARRHGLATTTRFAKTDTIR